MPVVAVNLTAAVYAEISQHVAKGLYMSPEQFLEIAAFNQVALERGALPDQLSTRNATASLPVTSSRSDKAARSIPRVRGRSNLNGTSPTDNTRANRLTKATSPSGPSSAEVQDCMMRLSRRVPERSVLSPRPPQKRSDTERLWAQFNRLFTLKFACRWLAFAHADATEWKRLSASVDTMSADAAVLGSALEEADARAGRKRDALLATGMPRIGNMASRDRFIAQTIARTTRAGRIYPGAICQYALASFDEDRLALTDTGLAFARLENPIIDGSLGNAYSSLSFEERSFLIQEVKNYVPGELADFKTVLDAIRSGQVTPEELGSHVRSELPADWTDQLVRTHVAGVVARLAELGMLVRHWHGRHVRYEAADAALALTVPGGQS